MASEWICYLDNQEFGPISEQDLMELIREGTVPVNSYIRRPTDTEWTTVDKVFGADVLKRQDFSPQGAVTSQLVKRPSGIATSTTFLSLLGGLSSKRMMISS